MSTASDPISYSDIDTRGYLYLPSFLSDSQVEMLARDFDNAKLEVNANYSVRRISQETMEALTPAFQSVIDRLDEQSKVHVDRLNDGVYFATYAEKATLANPRKGAQAFPWHQDHENYWMWNDTYNYLNFYIPVIKPERERSNLTVVPFDRLRERADWLVPKLLNRGATRVLPSGKRWVVKDDDRGGKLGMLDFDLREIEETPSLAPGDLLLLRGDVIHRTQDSSTRRVAASVRYIDKQTPVRRSGVARGGLAKSVMVYNARYLFDPIFSCFDKAGVDELPAGVIDDHLHAVRAARLSGEAVPNPGRLAFILRLLREKWRARSA